ncbi:hypothetical protein BGX38DRAFT_1256822 [Terfezia claveryi]|nr:hypothetical protein BGX38DRAFT_1256822 [Terfezia claveryi]
MPPRRGKTVAAPLLPVVQDSPILELPKSTPNQKRAATTAARAAARGAEVKFQIPITPTKLNVPAKCGSGNTIDVDIDDKEEELAIEVTLVNALQLYHDEHRLKRAKLGGNTITPVALKPLSMIIAFHSDIKSDIERAFKNKGDISLRVNFHIHLAGWHSLDIPKTVRQNWVQAAFGMMVRQIQQMEDEDSLRSHGVISRPKPLGVVVGEQMRKYSNMLNKANPILDIAEKAYILNAPDWSRKFLRQTCPHASGIPIEMQGQALMKGNNTLDGTWPDIRKLEKWTRHPVMNNYGRLKYTRLSKKEAENVVEDLIESILGDKVQESKFQISPRAWLR